LPTGTSRSGGSSAGALQAAGLGSPGLAATLLITHRRWPTGPRGDECQFLRPAHPGRLTGRGRIVRRGKEMAFLAGELLDDSGQIVAVATATTQIRAVPS
jgi:acyl-coenzyme A thioesterase PaaI-like protein